MDDNKNEQSESETLNKINPGKTGAVGFFSFLLDLVKTFVVVMLIAFAIRYFVIQPFVVDGDSMTQTFVNNEYLIAEKISYDFKAPNRGDVVIFRYPKNPSIIYIKRVIGLPGETVNIKDNKVMVGKTPDGPFQQLTENYLLPDVKTSIYSNEINKEDFKLTLKSDEFFVLGDNREHSSDSREWGVLPKANIIGRVWLTVTPLERFKLWSKQSY
ncbi:MAG: signal peptidase I [Patescibacteria group bacterium]